MAKKPASCPTERTDAVVYFVLARSIRMVKIGVSRDIAGRVRNVSVPIGEQTVRPSDLEIVGIMHGGYRMEGVLHRRFADYRTVGEWFRWSRAIDEYVKAIGTAACDGCDLFPETPTDLRRQLDAATVAAVLEALEACDWNNSAAARRLSVSRSHLIGLRRRYKL